MKAKALILFFSGLAIVLFNSLIMQKKGYHPEFREAHAAPSFGINAAYAYPPAVGILSNSKNCISCHVNNGPWQDENKLIIDVLDMETKKSLKQPDGSFLIEVKRWEQKTVLTVIGQKKNNVLAAPYRNAWLYIDPAAIGAPALSKFAANWDVNLPMSCRIVGDKLPGYEDADITSLPMTVQPLSNATDTDIQLQVMLTKGESVKGNAKEGMIGNYFEKKVFLKIKRS
jgi:hypothetical protein